MKKLKILDLGKVCDRCFKTLENKEELWGFNIFDDLGKTKTFKGHKKCVREMEETVKELYIEEDEE